MLGYIKTFPRSWRRWFKSERGNLPQIHVEQVLNGHTQQPISYEDFRLYLQNKEHTVNNLEFHEWYLGYKKRFNELPEQEKQKSFPPKEPASPQAINLPLHEFLKEDTEKFDPIRGFKPLVDWPYKTEQNQPFRAEINSVLQTFLIPGAMKELNIEPYRFKYVMYNACVSTHPDVFQDLDEYIYTYMNDVSLRKFLHFALQNVRYVILFFFYFISMFLYLQVPMMLYFTYSMHAPRVYRMPIVIISFISSLLFALGRSGVSPFHAILKRRQVPLYQMEEYKESLKGGKSVNKYSRSRKVDIETQVKSRNWFEARDPDVCEYNKHVIVHCIMFMFLYTGIVTALVIGISNEYDPETLAKMIQMMKDAAAKATASTA